MVKPSTIFLTTKNSIPNTANAAPMHPHCIFFKNLTSLLILIENKKHLLKWGIYIMF